MNALQSSCHTVIGNTEPDIVATTAAQQQASSSAAGAMSEDPAADGLQNCISAVRKGSVKHT